MSVATLEKPPKSAAPGPYLGFSLQQLRLCHHLLRVPNGDSVSLEHLDDVTVHRADGTLLLEQCKSALSGNPISDRAEDLWNTFANWADACAGGIDPVTTDFCLYVAPAKEGALVRELHGCQTLAAALAILPKIKALIDAEKPAVGCAPHVARFLKAGDSVCAQIIRRFFLTTHSDPLEIIRQPLRAVLPEETLEDFCATAIGMARDAADDLIRKGQAPVVVATDYRRRFRAFVRKHDLSGLLLSNTPVPGLEAIQALVDNQPVFVRQLKAIEASEALLITAVSDYLRSEADKIDWADDGLIMKESLSELDDQLERQHTLICDEVHDVMAAETSEKRGRIIYRRCSQMKLPLEGRVVPSHFVPGAYNSLADCLRVGWHPEFKTMFQTD